MKLKRLIKFHIRRFIRILGKAAGSSHQIALGMAIGFLVGWLPIVGIQMIVAMALCQIFKANKVIPLFPVWLTNPVTIIPIYSFNYWIGWLIFGGPPLSEVVEILHRMISPPTGGTVDSSDFILWWEGIKQSISELASMGWDMQLPLWTGCVIVGTALAIPSYIITVRLVNSFRAALAAKRRNRTKKSLRYSPNR